MLNFIPHVWSYVEPFVAIAGLILLVRTYVQTRVYQKKLSKQAKGTKLLIINFTSHPVSVFEDDWGVGVEQVHIPCTIPLEHGPDAVANFFQKLILKELESDVTARILAGDPNLYIATPKAGLAEFLAVWHGISGGLPKVIRAYKAEKGFLYHKPTDLQDIRLESRKRSRG